MRARTIAALVSAALLLTAPPLAGAENPDKLATQCSAGNKKSCQKLIAVARDSTADARLLTAAMQKAADQASLAEIAKTAYYPPVCRAAVANITNQALLFDIAKTATDDEVSRAAVEKISDQARLVDIAKADAQNLAAAQVAAVKKISDQAQLLDIAKTGRSSNARSAAMEGITDQAVLVDLITSAGDQDLRKSAIVRLSDSGRLKDLAASYADPVIRAEAQRHLSRIVAQAAEDAIVDSIRKNGIGSRFHLSTIHAFDPGDALPEMKRVWQAPSSYTLVPGVPGQVIYAIAEYPKDTIFQFMGGGGFLPMVALRLGYPKAQVSIPLGSEGIDCGKFAPGGGAQGYYCGDSNGSVWRFRGRHVYKGVVFDGAQDAPLTFMFWEPAGFVYVTGEGAVVTKDGEITRLP